MQQKEVACHELVSEMGRKKKQDMVNMLVFASHQSGRAVTIVPEGEQPKEVQKDREDKLAAEQLNWMKQKQLA